MDEQKRLLIAIVIMAAAVFLMTTFWPSSQPQQPQQQATDDQASAADDSEDEEPEDEAEEEPEAAEADLAEPAKGPTKRELREEHRANLKTPALEVELSSHGGGLVKAILLDPQFTEGTGDDAPQIDLVSANVQERPELQPLAFNLVRRRPAPPSIDGSAETEGVLRLVTDRDTTAEWLENAAEIRPAVAETLVTSRFDTLDDLREAIPGSTQAEERILAQVLAAAWQSGYVRLDFELIRQEEDRVVFRARTDDNIEIVRTVSIAGDYEIRIHDKIINRGTDRIEVRERLSASGMEQESEGGFAMFQRPTGLLRGLCLHGDDMVRRDRSRLAGDDGGCAGLTGCGGPPGPASRTGQIRFVAVDRHFFMTAITPSESWSDTTCHLRGTSTNLLEASIEPAVYAELEPGDHTTFASTTYLGPKQFDLLSEVGPGRRLWEAIDYGWFAFLSHYLLAALRLFHSWFGNWGLAIMFLTLLIKTVLLPVTHKTFKNMREMQRDMAALKPELDAINEKYKDKADVKQQKTLELYQQHGINPLKQVTGCLPMFLQMPIWIALYRMISESVEIYNAPFVLWLTDLSAQDPYYILPGLLGVSMFVQQWITPQPGVDNAQAKMMKWMMPAMFIFIMINMPAGLVLYIFVNTLLTIVQQQFINRLIPAVEPAKKANPDKESTDDGPRSGKKSKSKRRKRK